jgi:hypothetical protein
MSNESENKRIDYAHFAGKFTYGTGRGSAGNWTKAELKILLDEISRMYKREDELLDALQVIKEDLETGIAQGNIPINATNGIDLTKIRNFANDASE